MRPNFTLTAAKNQLTQICSEKRRAQKRIDPAKTASDDEISSQTTSITASGLNKSLIKNNEESSKKKNDQKNLLI